MFYKLKLTSFPKITNFYSVIRNTVWQISDKDNILIIINEGMCEISCDTDTSTPAIQRPDSSPRSRLETLLTEFAKQMKYLSICPPLIKVYYFNVLIGIILF